MNRLSLAPVTINEIEPPALIAAAASAGFDSADLRVLGAPGAAPAPSLAGDRQRVAAIAAASADSGVTIYAATGIWLTPEFSLDPLIPALEIAARLGAEQFLAVGKDRKSTRLNSSHPSISYAVFCLKKKK